MNDPGRLFDGAHRVLIVQLSAIGDVLRAGSVVSTIRRCYPGVRVGMLVLSDYADVLSGIPGLTYRHVFPNLDLKRHLNAARTTDETLQSVYRHAYLPLDEIQARSYDVAVNFHFSAFSAYLSSLSGAKKILGMSPCPTGEIDVHGAEACELYDDLRSCERAARSNRHLAIRYHSMCDLPVDEIRMDFSVPPWISNPLTGAPARFAGPHGRPVAIHVGAGWPDKCWPAERWASLIRRMHREYGWTPVLVGSAAERDRNFASVLSGLDFPVTDLCGRPFLETAAALSDCGLFIGADSGPMHLASALGVPVVALFGPTLCAESYPLHGRNAVIRKSRMAEIEVEEVWEGICAVARLLPRRLPTWEEAILAAGPSGPAVLIYENPLRVENARIA